MNLSSIIIAAAGNPIPDGSGSWTSSIVDELSTYLSVNSICWSGQKVFLLLSGSYYTNAVLRNIVSGDPQYWDRVAMPVEAPRFYGVFAKNNIVIAYNPSSTYYADLSKIAVSVDSGSSYTIISLPYYMDNSVVGYINGVFTILSPKNNIILTSTNGVTWTFAGTISGWTTPISSNVGSTIATTVDAVFCFFQKSSDPYITYVLRTTNGANWTVLGSLPYTAPAGIAWNGSVLCTVLLGTSAGSANVVGLSPDGITWTYNYNLQALLTGVGSVIECIIYDNKYFVAFGSLGYIAVSEDGITWTLRTSLRDSVPFSGSVRRAVWDGENIWANVIRTNPSFTGFTMAVTS